MKLGNQIKQIIDIDSEAFSIKIRFTDGVVMTVPMKHIFEKPKGLAAEVLRGGMFEKCFLESGALAWPNGLEFCPDAMRMWGQESEKASRSRKQA
ncbi:MAG: DUF2442 domain-containing protein [Deltaproteobacteria bacterium]|nr:DUF2442 domain-containing protein [Deltaproteobacteria bacterium]